MSTKPDGLSVSFTTILKQLLPGAEDKNSRNDDNEIPGDPSLSHMLYGPPSGHSLHPHLTARIASLQLHPTLEALLHILNADLPSAHFLVRHMQSPPAVEGMLLHAVLHRCEGDFENARAWVRSVCMDDDGMGLVKAVYGGLGGGGEEVGGGRDGGAIAVGMIDDVERMRDGYGNGDDSGKALEGCVRIEMSRLADWCSTKFGAGRWEDASEAWVRPGERIKQIGQDMTTGDKGHRVF